MHKKIVIFICNKELLIMRYSQHIFSKLYFHLIRYHMFHALALCACMVKKH